MTMMRSLLGVLILLLSGCSTTVVVKGTFPQPLVRAVPLDVGVYYSEQFRNFEHRQMEDGKLKYSISIGASQLQLFDTMFGAVFARVISVADLPPMADMAGLSALFVPEVEEFQLSVPQDAQAGIFEIWIKYRMRLLTPGGDVIHEWPMTAYGKTPEAFMKSEKEALHQAAIVALRDAGAHFAVDLLRDPNLRGWLESNAVPAEN